MVFLIGCCPSWDLDDLVVGYGPVTVGCGFWISYKRRMLLVRFSGHGCFFMDLDKVGISALFIRISFQAPSFIFTRAGWPALEKMEKNFPALKISLLLEAHSHAAAQ